MSAPMTPQAAVVGGSVVAFAGSLPASHREDIFMSTAYAQKTTRAAIEDGLSADWFEYYCKVLKFIGWDVPKPQTLTPLRNSLMAGQATQRISTIMGEEFSEPMRRALVAMERNTLALKLFESTSIRGNAGFFQIIPCVMSGLNKVQMGIYNRQFRIKRQISGFLFGEDETLIHDSVEQIAAITFNTLYYAQFREKVKESVISGSLNYLSSLEI
ncbi:MULTISPECIES: hypothetical protein [unclassified Pseudomonas]|uniref:hypothetical protein n=1 Tax=unclassified Pseudomonas TaxID=196821 RepID=UPI001B33D739|nr:MULTISPECIES: hypothetical protein [unclassified Pseudomonas]MBP5945863.1 hypothetical protein [Pseudomonas sp. P9(2020)]MBZ9564003.1 hypothetical protein [Pseudomonas sp. P116]